MYRTQSRNHWLNIFFALFFIALAVTWSGGGTAVYATNFTVNSTTDAVDASPGNGTCASSLGECTLRAAIQEANALAGADTITLPAGTYTLALAGTGEDAAATGDLDVTGDLTITGAGEATTIIQAGVAEGSGIDRVLEVVNSGIAVGLSDLTIRYGTITGNGGGIYSNGDMTVSNVALRDNSATIGAGGYFAAGSITMNNVTIASNAATNNGGGLHIRVANNLTNITVDGNTSGGSAAGVHIETALGANVTSSIFTNNINAFNTYGGGLYTTTGPATVT
ncbi:MAG: CSLREA domain-containing protein, partial [Anaerolineales bacterium]|nr:CSLREA domain-containing protein [Anaerolineales bacterium]